MNEHNNCGKNGVLDLDECVSIVFSTFNGTLPMRVVEKLPPETGLKFRPPRCVDCGEYSQYPFGFFEKNGSLILISICKNCGFIQFPRIQHIVKKLMEKLQTREGSHEIKEEIPV